MVPIFFWLIRKIMGVGKNSCPAQSAPLNEFHVSKLSQNVVYDQPFFLLVNFCQNEKLNKLKNDFEGFQLPKVRKSSNFFSLVFQYVATDIKG